MKADYSSQKEKQSQPEKFFRVLKLSSDNKCDSPQ